MKLVSRYMTLTAEIFSIFACNEKGGRRSLYRAPEIECDMLDPEFKTLRYCAIVFAVIYGGGKLKVSWVSIDFASLHRHTGIFCIHFIME